MEGLLTPRQKKGNVQHRSQVNNRNSRAGMYILGRISYNYIREIQLLARSATCLFLLTDFDTPAALCWATPTADYLPNMAGNLAPHLIDGHVAVNFGDLQEICEHMATFLSQKQVAMMVMTSKADVRPWRRTLARNSAVLEAQCEFHHGSPWHGHTIFDVFLCGCCTEKVCDLCIRKSGKWCGGFWPFQGCKGLGGSAVGLHEGLPLCNLCALDRQSWGGDNRQLCASCYLDYEQALVNRTGDYPSESWSSDEDVLF